MREGSPISLGEIKRLQTTIEEMYREKGFRFAKADFVLEEVSPTERRVVFTIDEAEKVRIGDIKFADNTIYGDWRLKWAMSKTKETNIVWRMLKRDIYNPATIAEDLVKVEGSLSRSGLQERPPRGPGPGREGEEQRQAPSGDRDPGRSRASASSSARSGSRATRSSTRAFLAAQFSPPARRLAALDDGDEGHGGGSGRLQELRAHLRQHRYSARRARETTSPTSRSRSPRATSTASAAWSSRATRGRATRCCAASSGFRRGRC